MTDLTVRIGRLTLKNPVLTASGTFGYGPEYADYVDLNRLGGLITKTITLEPRGGNPMPRIAEMPAGMLNSIGLANVGVERYLAEKLPLLEKYETAVIANLAGSTVEEYARVVMKVQKHPRVDGIEVNVSCPNVRKGGLAFGTDPDVLCELVRSVRSETDKTVIVKLSPNVTDIRPVAMAAASGGADALSLINTVMGMGIDIRTRKPLISRITAGLSGPAIKPIAMAKVYEAAQAVDLPLIGIGGIMNGEDAVEFLMAGASAVQVGTLNFVDPAGCLKVLEGIETFCREQGIAKVSDLVGAMDHG
ncbi:MAG TPA: dihydroorotate dehydrogenase [bacterium]|nr:dihydroorotate dehydrogenase [bacterium]